LIEQGAIVECEHPAIAAIADPDAWNGRAKKPVVNPFPGATPEACVSAIEDVMRGTAIPARTATRPDSISARLPLY
jgi:hypothetical protein